MMTTRSRSLIEPKKDDDIVDFHSNDQASAKEEFEGDEEGTLVLDAFAYDHFPMDEFKVRRYAWGRSHDWTECPYAHPGEKARQQDPRWFHYSGAAWPDFRKGIGCKKGDAYEYAYGMFECWLHPARYRTQPCKDWLGCHRRVCFLVVNTRHDLAGVDLVVI